MSFFSPNTKVSRRGAASFSKEIDYELFLLALEIQGSDGLVMDRKYRLRTYKNVFVGKDLVTWLLQENKVRTRKQGVQKGRQMMAKSIFIHVSEGHDFEDE
jgi:hypothetical protein